MSALSSDTNALQPAPKPIPNRGLHRRLAAYLRERPHLLLLAAIIILAVALRLAWIAYVNPDPNDGRADDTLFYDHTGQSLAAGLGYTNFFGAQTAQWPPGYPFLLAAIFKLAGHTILLPKILNAFAAGATCLLMYLLATKLFDRRVGLLAALVFAAFPGQVFYSTLLLTESIFPALLGLILLLLVVWVLDSGAPTIRQCILLGVLFGVAMLTRGEAGVLLLVALFAWKLVVPSWRRFVGQSSVVVLTAALVVAPWTVRNAFAMHAFIPVVSGMGHTLLAGHQPDPYNPLRVFPEAKIQAQYSYLPFPERETKVEQVATDRALDYIVNHPHDELLVFPFEKLHHLYGDDSDALLWVRGGRLPGVPAPQIYSQAVEGRWSNLADGYYFVVMVSALVGLPLWFSLKNKKRLLIILVVVGWTAAHLLFLPTPRYHSPLSPIFALWAAVPVIALYDFLRARLAQRRPVAAPSRESEA